MLSRRPHDDPRPAPPAPGPVPREHGRHTLRVEHGTVVGLDGDDVFVELSPRRQGVISLRRFGEPPRVGDAFGFTLRGQEEGLWVLELEDHRPLVTWEEMEVGRWVEARAVSTNAGGLELKVGPLHGFMPKSETGLGRRERATALLGRALVCEVLEVDAERQRVILSRKAVLQARRADARARANHAVRPGDVVHGRVTRLEDYGAFVAFGNGREGLVHVSNLAHERVAHPSDVLAVGEPVEAKVLAIRRGGRRVALGLKQMTLGPWADLEQRCYEGQVLEGLVVRVEEYGAFVEVEPGVVGLLHRGETSVPDARALPSALPVGTHLPVRVLSLDLERERMALSSLRTDGSALSVEEARVELAPVPLEGTGRLSASFGERLRAALAPRTPPEARAG